MDLMNNGKAVRLGTLILCSCIADSDVVSIYDAAGAFVVRGRWYNDQILDYGESWGFAWRDGQSVRFNLR